jgi:acetyl esterase/lipase
MRSVLALLALMSTTVSADRVMTRALHHALPLSVQHFVRDSGLLGIGVDAATMASASLALAAKPRIFANLARATASGRIGVPYGALPQQRVDIFEPRDRARTADDAPPVVLFVHGGAWGSGSRLIYRLVGHRFAEEGFTCVVIGYRRYPRANIDEMVEDVGLALRWASESAEFRARSRHLLGHSSGAHVALMAVLRRAEARLPPLCASFAGVAGVYDIARHLEFEAGRGVHEVSPMKPAAGGPAGFASASPSVLAPRLSAAQAALVPPVLLLHGSEDTTVPFDSSTRMAAGLRSAGASLVQCIVLVEKGHADLMLELSQLVAERRYAQMKGEGGGDALAPSDADGGLVRTLDPILELFERCGSTASSRASTSEAPPSPDGAGRTPSEVAAAQAPPPPGQGGGAPGAAAAPPRSKL